MIKPISHIALQGLQRSQQGVNKAAGDIARYPVKGSQTDLNRSLLELRQHETSYKANAQTLKAADQTIGTLLDEMA